MKNSGCIGWFPAVLTLIFVVAKITGYIGWSWWLVFSPVLFGVGIAIVVLVATLALAILADRGW